jgi:hypothetical protein
MQLSELKPRLRATKKEERLSGPLQPSSRRGSKPALTQSLSASIRYQGEVSCEADTHAIEGGLKLNF